MTEKTEQTGLMAGAHPTAPGGMSQKALVAELVDKHGFERADARALDWPTQIEYVAQGRLDREAEAVEVEALSEYAKYEVDTEGDGTVNAWADEDNDPVCMCGSELSLHGPTENHAFVDAEHYLDACALHGLLNCAECNGAAKAYDQSLEEPHMFDLPADTSDSDLDPEALMADLAQTQHEQHEHAIQHGLLIRDPHTLDYIFDGHSGAGPSASERWMHCTASVGASREFLETLTPNQQEQFANSNEAARQGTTAHAAAEVEAQVVLGNLSQEEADLTMLELSIMPESDGEAYDEEMGEYIVEYVDLVRTYAQDRGNENVLIEARVSAVVPLTGLHEGEVYEITGSGDCIVLPTPEEPTLVVADLKYGNGIWVDVDQNSQARIYGLGALGLLADPETGQLPEWLDEVTYHIVQPRMDGIKTWSEPLHDLLKWRDEVLAPKLTATLYGQDNLPDEVARFAPSDAACQFCPARGGCAALAEQRLTLAADLFDVVVEAEYDGSAFPETASLTDTRLGELLIQITGLIDIHKDLKEEAERRLYRGGAVPGFQLVNYTPPRKWKEGAGEALQGETELWTSKLITPTQALKLAKAKGSELGLDETALTPLIDVPDKRPVVAREGDRRKTWEGRPPESMFDDESGDE